jgi:hypothetical protein
LLCLYVWHSRFYRGFLLQEAFSEVRAQDA